MFGESAFDPARAISYSPFEDQIAALQEAHAAGLIAAWGVSNETPWGVAKWCSTARRMGAPPPSVVQNAHSLLCRTAEAGVFEACHEEGVRFDAYSPLAMGLLTGKYRRAGRGALQGLEVLQGAAAADGLSGEVQGSWAGPADSRLVRYKHRYAEAESRCVVAERLQGTCASFVVPTCQAMRPACVCGLFGVRCVPGSALCTTSRRRT